MAKQLLICSILVLLVIFAAGQSSAFINEIMYAPLDDNEFIELKLNYSELDGHFKNNSLFLNATITDNMYTDKIQCCDFVENCSLYTNETYLIITDQDTTLYENWTLRDSKKYCVDDNSIGNGLGNSDDTINLTFVYNNSLSSYTTNYEDSMGAYKDGKSLQLFNGSLIPSPPTPGEDNVLVIPVTIYDTKIDINSYDYYKGQTYDNLFTISFLNKSDCGVDDSLKGRYWIRNESVVVKNDTFIKEEVGCSTFADTGFFTIEKPGNYRLCGKIVNTSFGNNRSNNDLVCRDILVKNVSIIKDVRIERELEDFLISNYEYSDLFGIELVNKSSCGNKDNVSVSYEVYKNMNQTVLNGSFEKEIGCTTRSNTGSIIFEKAGNYTVCGKINNTTYPDQKPENNKVCFQVEVVNTGNIDCDIALDIGIENEKEFYDNGDKLEFYNNLNNESFPYQIEYYIEDLFGNTVKDRINTSNTNKKSYTFDLDEKDAIYYLKSRLNFIGCNDTNPSNNHDYSKLLVKGNQPQNNSDISIEKVYTGTDNSVKFGQTVRVRVKIYKADTTKTSVKMYLLGDDNIKYSKVTYTNFYDEFKQYEQTIPLQLKPNCNEKYDDGNYRIMIEGLDEEDSDWVEVKGITSTLCSSSSKKCECPVSTHNDSTKKKDYEIIDYPEKIEEDFFVKVRLYNDDEEKNEYKIWSYLYEGPVCYSGERKDNILDLSLESDEEKVVNLLVKSDKGLNGEYKLKVKIKKNEQITNYEWTKDVIISTKKQNNGKGLNIVNVTNNRTNHVIVNLLCNSNANVKLLTKNYNISKKLTCDNGVNKINFKMNNTEKLLAVVKVSNKNTSDEKSIILKKNISKTNKSYVNTLQTKENLTQKKFYKNKSFIQDNETALNKTVYKSSSAKSRGLIIYLLGITGFLTLVSLFLKKW